MQNKPRKPRRITIQLDDDAAEKLESLATDQQATQSEAFRRAIATEAFLFRERQQGGTVLILKADKSIKEVLFR